MKQSKKTNKTIGFRLNKETYEKLLETAQKDNRSVASLVKIIIEKKLNQEG